VPGVTVKEHDIMESPQTQLQYLARALIWCFVLAVALQVFWWLIVLVAGDWAYGIHAGIFEITRHEFDLVMYCGLLFVKVMALVFFLIPYISLRIALRHTLAPGPTDAAS
jgi:hypothetical protein